MFKCDILSIYTIYIRIAREINISPYDSMSNIYKKPHLNDVDSIPSNPSKTPYDDKKSESVV